MANPAPALTPGTADLSVQSSISVGGRRAKADVAMVSLATGSEASEGLVSEPRSWLKMTPTEPHHGGRMSSLVTDLGLCGIFFFFFIVGDVVFCCA